MLTVILLVFAFVMLVVAGLVPPAPPAPGLWAWRLLCWGLACWALSLILGGVHLGPLTH